MKNFTLFHLSRSPQHSNTPALHLPYRSAWPFIAQNKIDVGEGGPRRAKAGGDPFKRAEFVPSARLRPHKPTTRPARPGTDHHSISPNWFQAQTCPESFRGWRGTLQPRRGDR